MTSTTILVHSDDAAALDFVLSISSQTYVFELGFSALKSQWIFILMCMLYFIPIAHTNPGDSMFNRELLNVARFVDRREIR